jgi:Protein of unknown function (DUF3485)
MVRQFLTLVILAAIGLGAVIALPKTIEMMPSAVKMEWPAQVGDWVKVRDTLPSSQELNILAKDTSFSNAEYIDARTNVHLNVGIVLSGMDPNNSIHRPERCLDAQGHTNIVAMPVMVKTNDGHDLPVTRLHTRMDKEIPGQEGEAPQRVQLNFVTYYWFIGNNLITGSHYTRTVQDIMDRVMSGSAQRWAYITVGVRLNDTAETRALANQPDSQVDKIVQDFLATVIPTMIDRGMIRGARP